MGHKMNSNDNSPITSFNGAYRFLSNFYPSPINIYVKCIFVECRFMTFPSVEHAYQAAKTVNLFDKIEISKCKTPGETKRLGRNLKTIDNWDNLKVKIMLDLLRTKFAIPKLRQKLLDTGDRVLIEGNNWGDTFWGVCQGEGRNELGKLLMQVRKEIK